MCSNVTNSVIDPVRKYLHSNLGLNFTEGHNKELIRKIGNAAVAFGYGNTEAFVDWLLNNELSNSQLETLAGYLTIGETYFLREKKGFNFLEQIYLPGLIQKRVNTKKQMRVWCAGCATGEEAYSLAITLSRSVPSIRQWNITILATDINRKFLNKAQKGIYTKWSFRNNSPQFIQKYFIQTGAGQYQVIPEIREMVTFSSLNLAKDNYPSETNNTQAFDIIFCRNVLIYFSADGARKVTEKFYNSLVNGGILVVSPVEMSGIVSPEFSHINYSGFTIFHKDGLRHETKEVNAFRNIAVPTFRTNPSPVLPKEKIEKAFHQSNIFQKKQNLQKKEIPIPETEKISEKNNYIEAKNLYEQGLFADTEKLLTCEGQLPETRQKLLLLAKTKANMGKLEEAEELCRKEIAIDKLDASLYYLLATIMQEKGDDEKAITCLKTALYLDPEFVLAHFLLGTLHLKVGNSSAGMRSFRNARLSLSKFLPGDILPESDGLTAKSFSEIINSIIN